MKTNPTDAIQHVRALHALTFVVTMLLPNVTEGVEQGAWLKGVIAELRVRSKALNENNHLTRKLSAGGHRMLDGLFKTMTRILGLMLKQWGYKKFTLWGAMTYASCLCLQDAIVCCPNYTDDPQWKDLHQYLDEVVERLARMEPRVAEEGTIVYIDTVPRDIFY